MTVLTQTIVSPRLSLVTDIKSIGVTNNNNVKVNEKRAESRLVQTIDLFANTRHSFAGRNKAKAECQHGKWGYSSE